MLNALLESQCMGQRQDQIVTEGQTRSKAILDHLRVPFIIDTHVWFHYDFGGKVRPDICLIYSAR